MGSSPLIDYLKREHSNPEIKKIMKLCEYVGDFLLITTQFLFAAHIHCKGVKLTPENSTVFRFWVITPEL